MIDATADGFPTTLSELPPGKYYAQAVLHRSRNFAQQGNSPGDLYSDVVPFVVPDRERNLELGDPYDVGPVLVSLRLDQLIDEPKPIDAKFQHEVLLNSSILSDYMGRPVQHMAMVILPLSYYDEPESGETSRRYPVVYIIPGFGSSHRDRYWQQLSAFMKPGAGQTEFIRVVLSGQCQWGHHAFGDSATNGPRGTAFVEEMVPYIDENFRTIADPRCRFLTGHSSGGLGVALVAGRLSQGVRRGVEPGAGPG